MSETNLQNFDKRMERLLRKHQRLSRGYVPAITDDGLIVAQPRRALRLPWRPVLFLLVVAFCAKIGFLTAMGPAAYETHVASLATGTQFEQVGAWIMSADPVTLAVSQQLGVLFN